MKAVVYHADSHFAWGEDVGDIYKILFRQFVKMCHEYEMEVVHLTTEGSPGWGDENHFYDLDLRNVVANREEVFTDYLEKHDGVFWFTEPDTRIYAMWPPLKTDCVMLWRDDGVPMTPSWRMATQKALPFFTELRDEMRLQLRKDWHGDSVAFNNVWKRMGNPGMGVMDYKGVSIEFRDFRHYVKGGRAKYTRNFLGESKKQLLDA